MWLAKSCAANISVLPSSADNVVCPSVCYENALVFLCSSVSLSLSPHCFYCFPTRPRRPAHLTSSTHVTASSVTCRGWPPSPSPVLPSVNTFGVFIALGLRELPPNANTAMLQRWEELIIASSLFVTNTSVQNLCSWILHDLLLFLAQMIMLCLMEHRASVGALWSQRCCQPSIATDRDTRQHTALVLWVKPPDIKNDTQGRLFLFTVACTCQMVCFCFLFGCFTCSCCAPAHLLCSATEPPGGSWKHSKACVPDPIIELWTDKKPAFNYDPFFF